jgi:hypothetical protein
MENDLAPKLSTRRAIPGTSPDLLLSILPWSAVLLQLWLTLHAAQAAGKSIAAGLIIYLGYFTVLTNIFVALTLSLPALAPATALGRFFARSQTQACAGASIALVGLVYHSLLRNIWNPEGLQRFADVLLHYVVPVAFCIYWLLAMPKGRLAWWSPLLWSVYPVAYVGYALVRGAALGSYPYPFIDVTSVGYSQVLANVIGLWIAFVLLGCVFLALSKAIDRRQLAPLGSVEPSESIQHR